MSRRSFKAAVDWISLHLHLLTFLTWKHQITQSHIYRLQWRHTLHTCRYLETSHTEWQYTSWGINSCMNRFFIWTHLHRVTGSLLSITLREMCSSRLAELLLLCQPELIEPQAELTSLAHTGTAWHAKLSSGEQIARDRALVFWGHCLSDQSSLVCFSCSEATYGGGSMTDCGLALQSDVLMINKWW